MAKINPYGPSQEENYLRKVKPKLEDIQKWRRSGYGVKQVASMLGINYSTMREYALRWPELEEALKKGEKELVIELENALFARALGFEYEEVQEYQEMREGRIVSTRRNVTRKRALPDTGALAFALKNKATERWSDWQARRLDPDGTERLVVEVVPLKPGREEIE